MRSFSSSGQSLRSELATLMIGKSNETQRSTDDSSNGVAIGMQLSDRISCTIRAKPSRDIRVASVFFT